MPGFSFLTPCAPSSFAVAVSVGSIPVLGSVDGTCCSVASFVVEVPFVVSRGVVLICSSVVNDLVVEEAFVNGKAVVSFCLVKAVVASEVGSTLTFVAGVVNDLVVKEPFVDDNAVVSFCLVKAVVASEVGLTLTFVAGVVGFVVVPSDGVIAAVVVCQVLSVVPVVALLLLLVALLVAPDKGDVAGTTVETTVRVVTCVSFVVLPRLVGGAAVSTDITLKVAYN